MTAGLVAGSVWFALFLLAHAAIVRRVPPVASARATQIAFVAGLAGTLASVWTMAAGQTAAALAGASLGGVLLYGGLFVLYMPFHYVVTASLSVRTAVMLGRHGGALPLTALHDRFASRRLVGERLRTMVDNGFLRATPAGYVLTAKGRRTAQVFDCLKRLWKLGAGG
jgi:hypothetical protein